MFDAGEVHGEWVTQTVSVTGEPSAKIWAHEARPAQVVAGREGRLTADDHRARDCDRTRSRFVPLS